VVTAPARGRHASETRRLEDGRRDLERYRVVEELRKEGYRLRPCLEKPSVFEAASWKLGVPASTLRTAHSRARRLLASESEYALMGADLGDRESYSRSMNDEHTDPGTVILTVRVRPSELEELRRVARAVDRPMASVMRLALRKVIDEHRGAGVPGIRA
jgi:hypothetical protein